MGIDLAATLLKTVRESGDARYALVEHGLINNLKQIVNT